MKQPIWVLLVFLVALSSCTVVREGEIGVRRTLGKYNENTYSSGLRFYNPFTSYIERVSVRTNNEEVSLNIPSKEGLTIVSEVSILYRIEPHKVPSILRTIGPEYTRNILLPVFRSAVSDVTSRFYAKDMHTGERATIEAAIRDQMMVLLGDRGIIVEAVLLKSIQLPRALSRAIEEKLEAEQQAQRMEFVLQEARQEADRKLIEATGVRDAQLILAEGLTPMILQFKSIEAYLELAKSPNAKIIIGNGDLPVLTDFSTGQPMMGSQQQRGN